MIRKLLPITENKLKILKHIYEKKETHLQEISKGLGLHPYSVQKTLKSIKIVLEERKAGKTILLKIDKKMPDLSDLLLIIEDYKLKTKNKELRLLIKNLQEFFSQDKNIICCIIFGSFARESITKDSDIDLLFVINKKDESLSKKLSQLSSLFDREINPLIFMDSEFKKAVEIKEPSIASILEPSQRLIIIGKKYFLDFNDPN